MVFLKFLCAAALVGVGLLAIAVALRTRGED